MEGPERKLLLAVPSQVARQVPIKSFLKVISLIYGTRVTVFVIE